MNATSFLKRQCAETKLPLSHWISGAPFGSVLILVAFTRATERPEVAENSRF
jgi:hypothetical protein